MSGRNLVLILGRVGKIELSYTATGMPVCSVSIATSHKPKDKEEVTSWHRCKAFKRSAEVLGQYVSVGDMLDIEGMLSYGSYEKDNAKHYTTEIIIDRFTFVGSKQDQPKQHQPKQQGQQPPQRQQQSYPPQQQYNVTTDPGFYEPPKDDGIPF